MNRQLALRFLLLAICTGVFVIGVNQSSFTLGTFEQWGFLEQPEQPAYPLIPHAGPVIKFWEPLPAHADEPTIGLPPLKPHPLPPSLAQWQDSTNGGDYFLNIKSVPVGYLIWSHLPVKIHIDSSTATNSPNSIQAVQAAIQEWNVYLPLEIVESSENADILISLKRPPLQRRVEGQLPRVRSAETRYEFYLKPSETTAPILSHRFTILLNPHQTTTYIQAATRHELGHALGIWGHSPSPSDVLYYSQVRYPPSISPRDVNTLKRIYEQPTRLGWSLPSN